MILPCFFVDFGEVRSSVRSSLKKLDSQFSLANIPGFAECCSTEKLSPEKIKKLPHLPDSSSELASLKKLDAVQLKINNIESSGDYRIVNFIDESGNPQKMEYLKNSQSKDTVSPRQAIQSPPVPASGLNLTCRDPEEMPKKKEVVHIISVTDPDNISIQLAAWVSF